jgi:hypothetical protein
MLALALLVAAAGLQPSLRKSTQKDEFHVATYALQKQGAETEPVKEITRDMFGFKFQDGQNGMCKMLMFMVCAGIFAQCVEGCMGGLGGFDPLTKLACQFLQILGSGASTLTLIYVFTNWHNGTRIWDQYTSGADLSTACYWVMVLAVFQLAMCGCLCCCTATVIIGAATMHPTLKRMKTEDPDIEITPKMVKMCEECFNLADKNKDGKVDAAELREFAKEGLVDALGVINAATIRNDPLFLEAFDKNGDHKLDLEEFTAMMAYLAKHGIKD